MQFVPVNFGFINILFVMIYFITFCVILLQKGEDIHDVHLFIFTNWPKGNAVPKTSDSVLQLVKAVDTVNRSKDKESTILVHCMYVHNNI